MDGRTNFLSVAYKVFSVQVSTLARDFNLGAGYGMLEGGGYEWQLKASYLQKPLKIRLAHNLQVSDGKSSSEDSAECLFGEDVLLRMDAKQALEGDFKEKFEKIIEEKLIEELFSNTATQLLKLKDELAGQYRIEAKVSGSLNSKENRDRELKITLEKGFSDGTNTPLGFFGIFNVQTGRESKNQLRLERVVIHANKPDLISRPLFQIDSFIESTRSEFLSSVVNALVAHANEAGREVAHEIMTQASKHHLNMKISTNEAASAKPFCSVECSCEDKGARVWQASIAIDFTSEKSLKVQASGGGHWQERYNHREEVITALLVSALKTTGKIV